MQPALPYVYGHEENADVPDWIKAQVDALRAQQPKEWSYLCSYLCHPLLKDAFRNMNERFQMLAATGFPDFRSDAASESLERAMSFVQAQALPLSSR